MIRQSRLYLFVALCSAAGLTWTWWNMVYNSSGKTPGCLFRYVTDLPCPSCGSTRSVMDIFHLHFAEALYANPVGFLLVAAMLSFPLWMLYDVIAGKDTFYRFYHSAERFMRRRWVMFPFIVLMLMNWVWNIYKF